MTANYASPGPTGLWAARGATPWCANIKKLTSVREGPVVYAPG